LITGVKNNKAGDSISTVALSVMTSSKGSPEATASPLAFNQRTMTASFVA